MEAQGCRVMGEYDISHERDTPGPPDQPGISTQGPTCPKGMGGDGTVVLLAHPARLGGEVLLFRLRLFYYYVQKLRKSSNTSIRTPVLENVIAFTWDMVARGIRIPE